jgi:hypothetical protein
MDIRIEKISNDLVPAFSHSLKGINGAVGTADMEENSHLCKIRFTAGAEITQEDFF